MKTFLSLSVCLLLATCVYGQRRGGGGFSGGFSHGGMSHGGFSGVHAGGGIGRGWSGSWGHGWSGWNGGWYGRGWGYRGGWGWGGLAYYPYGGFYGGYWPGYYDYGGGYPAYDPYPLYTGYGYSQSPNVTVVYPTQSMPAPTTVYVERAQPVIREYDEYGQERTASPAAPSSTKPPIYLIAFKDHVIRAASAYWVDGSTLRYVTLEHDQRSAPLSSVDRAFSIQLNRERRVAFQLP